MQPSQPLFGFVGLFFGSARALGQRAAYFLRRCNIGQRLLKLLLDVRFP